MKVTDLDPAQLLDIQEELLFYGFTIYYQDGNTIEAAYKDRYQKVLYKYREIESVGWKSDKKPSQFEYLSCTYNHYVGVKRWVRSTKKI